MSPSTPATPSPFGTFAPTHRPRFQSRSSHRWFSYLGWQTTAFTAAIPNAAGTLSNRPKNNKEIHSIVACMKPTKVSNLHPPTPTFEAAATSFIQGFRQLYTCAYLRGEAQITGIWPLSEISQRTSYFCSSCCSLAFL
jgi:hypothetical protein